MIPLGIIPAIVGLTLFYGYINEKDDINKYLFMTLSLVMFTVACFAPAELASACSPNCVYQPDPSLSALGYALGIITFVFLLLLTIRLGLGNGLKSIVDGVGKFK